MSPACGCQQRFGSSDCSVRATADSWPHSELAEILSITDVTPHTSQLRYDIVCFGDKRHLGMPKWRSSSVVPTTSRVNPDHGTPRRLQRCGH
jgi:hypothetical protein